jgi:putative transposase
MDWIPLKAGLFLWNNLLKKQVQINRRRGPGRPPADERRIFLGICYVLATGEPWRAVPNSFGARATLHRYFRRWSREGVFADCWRKLLTLLAQQKQLKLRHQIIDSSQMMVMFMRYGDAVVTRKFPGKRAVKLSLLVDQAGTPLSVVVASSHVHDTKLLAPTLEQFRNTRLMKLKPLHRRPRRTAKLLGDKGYIGQKQIQTARAFNYQPLFYPRIYERPRFPRSDLRTLKRYRWVIERSISWIRNYRRLKICYERTHLSLLGFAQLACCMLIATKILKGQF